MNINHFGPFAPEVWGSVSDWVYIIVTTATLYFIYRTFMAQLEVQRMQLKITNIENEWYRKESLPIFEAEVLEDQPGQPTDADKLLVSIGFGLKNSECKNLKLTVTSHMAKNLKWNHLAGNFQYVMAGGCNLIDVLVTKKDEENPYMFPIELNFQYEDMVGNQYKQNIHCIRRWSGKHQVYTFTPVPVIKNG
ncbi:MAG: hypothetical protein ACXVAY_06940 [Mucilaginibacter sp.]